MDETGLSALFETFCFRFLVIIKKVKMPSPESSVQFFSTLLF